MMLIPETIVGIFIFIGIIAVTILIMFCLNKVGRVISKIFKRMVSESKIEYLDQNIMPHVCGTLFIVVIIFCAQNLGRKFLEYLNL